MQPNTPTLADLRAALDALGPGPYVVRNDGFVGFYVVNGDTNTFVRFGMGFHSMRLAESVTAVLNRAAAMLPAIEALGGEIDAYHDDCSIENIVKVYDAARRVVEAANNKGTSL